MRSSETRVELAGDAVSTVFAFAQLEAPCRPVLCVPALERIHQLARRLEAAPHEQRLLAHNGEGIFEQPGLVFYGGRRRHCVRRERIVRGCGELGVDMHRRLGRKRSPSKQGSGPCR